MAAPLARSLTVVTVPPMAWRWQRLLDVRGVHERVPWLMRAYFVSYAVGQVLPTSVGGDASRIFETSRRHPGRITPITGSVLLERALGGAVTLLLAGVGLLLAIGRYPIGAYLWVELVFVLGTIAARSCSSRARSDAGSCSSAARAPAARGDARRAPSTTACTATATTPGRCSSSPSSPRLRS